VQQDVRAIEGQVADVAVELEGSLCTVGKRKRSRDMEVKAREQ